MKIRSQNHELFTGITIRRLAVAVLRGSNGYENASDDVTVKRHEISNEQFLNQLLLQERLKLNTPPRWYSRMLVPDQIFEKRQQFVLCNLSQVRFQN